MTFRLIDCEYWGNRQIVGDCTPTKIARAFIGRFIVKPDR